MAYLPSSTSIVHTVIADPVPDVDTTITLVAVPEPQEYSQDVTFTATVTAADGSAPTGSVQFYVDGAPLGAAVALAPTGSTTVDLAGTSLGIGNHPIEALFVP